MNGSSKSPYLAGQVRRRQLTVAAIMSDPGVESR